MDSVFQGRHKIKPKYFTRERVLTFPVVMVILFQKSVKSLQLMLNEFLSKLSDGLVVLTVTASAFTQARSKLAHTAFIELNTRGIVEPYYKDHDYKKYKGFRLLAIDSSKLRLPDDPAIKKEFGTLIIKSQSDSVTGEYSGAMASVLYDVLNHIAIDSILASALDCEINLALQHLEKTSENDLILNDRGYASYTYVATHVKRGKYLVCRCSKSSFTEVNRMFSSNVESRVITIQCPEYKRKKVIELGLPLKIRVRLVKVILDTGEIEILLTTILDEKILPTSDFKELYHLRWGVETFYGTIKGRTVLENFTGKTPEAVKQDFFSTIFISNLESVITEEANAQLAEKSKDNKYKQQVNKAVSFNAIKNYAIALLLAKDSNDMILEKLTKLFLQNPVLQKTERNVPRKKKRLPALLNYHKRIKKLCF
jgi:hypothetical protein